MSSHSQPFRRESHDYSVLPSNSNADDNKYRGVRCVIAQRAVIQFMPDQPVNPVLAALQNYIAQMAPHQEKRVGGRLLIRSKEEIDQLLQQHSEDSLTLNMMQLRWKLAEALLPYLVHPISCPRHEYPNAHCSCGLEAAVKAFVAISNA